MCIYVVWKQLFHSLCHDRFYDILLDCKVPAIASRHLMDYMYQTHCIITVWNAMFFRQFAISFWL